jgi:hypothetical protein
MDLLHSFINKLDFDRLLAQFAYSPKSPMIFNTGFFLLLFLGFLAVYQLLRNHHRAISQAVGTSCCSFSPR